jgi:hypothetical protein
MTNDLGRALLNLDSQTLTGLTDPREQTWKIIEHDRRRVWRWTALTIVLWCSAVGMVLLMLVAYGLVFPLQAKLAGYDEPAHAGAPQEPERIDLDNLTPEQRELAQFKAQIMFQMVTVGVTVSVGILGLAALSTVFLVLSSRKATLRQINASLLEISQQLKQLQQQSGKPAA